jgi:hypothetical protein
VSKYLNSLLFRKRGAIIRDIRALVPNWIRSQPEMQELLYNNGIGSLGAELGLEYGTGPDAVNAIVEAMVNSIAIDITKVDAKNLRGGIKLKFMPATFSDLLAIPEGHVITEKGQDLHWLKWLLLEGFSVVVVGYNFNFRRAGRSKGGYMREGGVWRVPPQYAGTVDNNFITRALNGSQNEEQISQIFKRHIKS